MKTETRGRKPYKKWHENFVLDAYEYAKSGLTVADIATAMNVCLRQFQLWMAKKPALKEAVKRGKSRFATVQDDFVAKTFSPESRKVWEELRDAHLVKEMSYVDRSTRIKDVLASCEDKTLQFLFAQAVLHFNFNYNKACRFVKIGEKKLNEWLGDPYFRELLEEIKFCKGNFYESALIRKVKEGDTAAVIFVNKTYNAKR